MYIIALIMLYIWITYRADHLDKEAEIYEIGTFLALLLFSFIELICKIF